MTRETPTLLAVDGLTVTYRHRGGARHGVERLSFAMETTETVAMIGSSGAGKSTVAHALAGLVRPSAGQVRIDGLDPWRLRPRARRQLRRRVHTVFQNPYEAFAPSMRLGDAVAEPLLVHGTGTRQDRRSRALRALRTCQLTPAAAYARRYPGELSGGELQRAALARAVIDEPALIVADEPTGMLDASLQDGLLDLMAELQETRRTACLLITHDVTLAQARTQRLVVLDQGRLVEQGPTERVLSTPRHPATGALVAASRGLDAVRDSKPRR